ncbi:MAG: glycosyltransferase [Candidatus Levybacteria bacterium]|nr:glycosyltransferase [Candidatus Levybacteria bacterium]
MKVALVYDRVNKWGGAERVLLALHKIFPKAPLYTAVYNREKAPWAKLFDVRTSFLQNFPHASFSHEFYASLMPLAFESFNFNEYDLVISVTSEAAKGIITRPKTLHICYCLTPTRYLWSGYEDYFKNKTFKILSKPVISYLKKWDKVAAKRPDYIIAISKEVKERIKKYYGRDSEVIFPPLTLAFNKLASNVQLNTKLNVNKLDARRLPYFLVVSRLVSYKRIDIAIDAFNNLKIPLKIVGDGRQKEKLRKIAKNNIEFLGTLTDEELMSYYKNCQALIFPGLEDFGLTVVEVQSFGKPVVAFGGGGALETVIRGKTGEFFDKQHHKSLSRAIKNFDSKKYKAMDCIRNSKRFGFERFEKELKNFLFKAIKNKN